MLHGLKKDKQKKRYFLKIHFLKNIYMYTFILLTLINS